MVENYLANYDLKSEWNPFPKEKHLEVAYFELSILTKKKTQKH